jgi:glutamate formiminotransferase/formiminotetrahydrofolate cyclodeaminase
MSKYILAVPNFSDGRRIDIIEAVVDQVRNLDGVKLLDYHPDPDFNRTVVTVLGTPEKIKDALLKMAGKSIELINMEEQEGSHPRIGAQDTIPIFPLRNISLGECIQLAEEIGVEVYEKFGVPVYFAGENARVPERRSLDFIRRGQYEGLKKVVHTETRKPDIGPAALHPTAGAVIVSAGTNPLVAYNVILDTSNLEIAQRIAKIVRGPSGGFTTVRSIGLSFSERKQVCVSMNMFDFEKTPIYRTHELVKLEASRFGINVVGSEIVGVVSLESLVNSLEYYLGLEGFERKQILENHLLDLGDSDGIKVSMETGFLDRLASSAPSPGGGSAAAFSGALASALISMVARLTVGRAKYAEVDGRMNTIASRAEVLRSWFQDAVKKDEEAFENLMLARKQPRNTDEEIAFREKAIADAIEGAAYVPLQVVEKSVEVMRLAREVAEFGNLNAITDAGSAASLAWSALKAASLNVKINASSALDEMKAAEWIRAVDEYDMDAEIQFSGLKNALKSRANITY